MKKTLSIVMLFELAFTMAMSVSAAKPVDGRKTCTAYIGEVALDGKIDDAWEYAPVIKVDTVKQNASKWYGDKTKVAGKDYATLDCKVLWDGKSTRNLALSRYRSRHAARRGEEETALAIDELSDIVSGEDVEETVDMRAISVEISAFLREQPEKKRVAFVLRYWYAKSVSEVARQTGQTESACAMTLSRMRKKLAERLSERGFSI